MIAYKGKTLRTIPYRAEYHHYGHVKYPYDGLNLLGVLMDTLFYFHRQLQNTANSYPNNFCFYRKLRHFILHPSDIARDDDPTTRRITDSVEVDPAKVA